MVDKILTVSIIIGISILLVWRVWRIMTGRASGCSCASRSCPLLQDGQCLEKDMKNSSQCRAATIVTDQPEADSREQDEKHV